jgi:CrcB-like protein
VCGGFTTFSAFSVETAGLLQSGKTGLAMLYTALSLLLGVTVVLLGQRLVR